MSVVLGRSNGLTTVSAIRPPYLMEVLHTPPVPYAIDDRVHVTIRPSRSHLGRQHHDTHSAMHHFEIEIVNSPSPRAGDVC